MFWGLHPGAYGHGEGGGRCRRAMRTRLGCWGLPGGCVRRGKDASGEGRARQVREGASGEGRARQARGGRVR